jgi:uncharacterized phage-associated protein
VKRTAVPVVGVQRGSTHCLDFIRSRSRIQLLYDTAIVSSTGPRVDIAMEFRFNLEKTIQAIAAFLHFHGSTEMSYLRMLKLLYLADRESLKETGRPITGDRVVAMEHGPVLSSAYDLIKGQNTGWPEWTKFLRKKGYRIELVQDPGNGSLSKYEIGKLSDLTERYADKNEWDMVEIVHEFDEWKKNYSDSSCSPIPFGDILEAIGRSADKDAILQDASDQTAFDRFFAQEMR